MGKDDQIDIARDRMGKGGKNPGQESEHRTLDSPALLDDADRVHGIAQLPADQKFLQGGDAGRNVAADHGEGEPVTRIDHRPVIGQD